MGGHQRDLLAEQADLLGVLGEAVEQLATRSPERWHLRTPEALAEELRRLATTCERHAIARSLGVSERTVRTEVAAVRSALGARSRAEAAYLAGTRRLPLASA